MKASIFFVLGLALVSGNTFAKDSGISQDCHKVIYNYMKGKLPYGQWAQDLTINDQDAALVDMQIVKDMGDANYCFKSAQVRVKFENETCEVVDLVHIDKSNQFDCG